ncbi:MAG: DNA double-strand break repair nuclease NurA [Methanomicrobiales archaeon]|nr:DNA double-strand break repair nuclease NurA [Methanomicrobiales archaeon]
MRDAEYDREIQATTGLLRAVIPANLAEKFGRAAGISAQDFQKCHPADGGTICAVDGSHSMAMESGSTALALFRAAQTTFRNQERIRRSLTPLKFALIGTELEDQTFPRLYQDCFGEVPETPLPNDERSRTASILMETLEYWVTEQMAKEIDPGALLLRDGPLRVSHASHDRVLIRIAQTCMHRGLDLAGVSKQSTATWGGGHPLLLSVSVLARSMRIHPPWWISIDPLILDHAPFSQWQHGQTYVVLLHSRARKPLKVELPRDLSSEEVSRIMDRLAACSADGRIPGYPYPLLDAHRSVVLTREVVEQVRTDLISGLIAGGIDRQTYEILFGDVHDEFARY